MINYYLRPEGAHIKVDHDTKKMDLVLNLPAQKTISMVDSLDYYNNIINAVSGWTVSDQSTYETNRSQVLQELNGR